MELIKEKMAGQINVKTGRARAEGTITLYIKSLKSLHLRLFNTNMENIYWLIDTEKVLEGVADFNKSTMNNYLSACIAGLETLGNQQDLKIEDYRKKIAENNLLINANTIEQKKTQTEDKNWCKLSELQGVANSYRKELIRRQTFTKTAETMTPAERELLKFWLIANLYTIDPVNNPPLRADYAGMKIIPHKEFITLNTEELLQNYLVVKSSHKKYFSLGKYKTVGTYGIKHIPLGKKLNGVMNKFLKLHDKEYLIYNCSGKSVIQANAFTKVVQRVFEPSGKNITINLLRHIVLTEFDTGPSIKEKIDKAELMCHSTGCAAQYVKKD